MDNTYPSRQRRCPTCKTLLTGTLPSNEFAIDLDEDFLLFVHTDCGESWYENVAYCLPDPADEPVVAV